MYAAPDRLLPAVLPFSLPLFALICPPSSCKARRRFLDDETTRRTTSDFTFVLSSSDVVCGLGRLTIAVETEAVVSTYENQRGKVKVNRAPCIISRAYRLHDQ